MESLEAYALKILADAGCDCYTYGQGNPEQLMDDLKTEFPDGMLYPYVDVANAILAISRPKPIVRTPYRIYWDNGVESCGNFNCQSLSEAKYAVIDMLCNWMATEKEQWENEIPNKEEKDHWDYMIYNAYAEVYSYNKDTDDYEEEWSLSDEEAKEIGWVAFEDSESIDDSENIPDDEIIEKPNLSDFGIE